jgi:hypothetical protein
MDDRREIETLGAWVVHHGRKLQSDQKGPSEFSAIDGAAKSGLLLAEMSSSDDSDLSASEVMALAKIANLNPKTELKTYLELLEKRQLIDISASGAISVLGVSSRKVLQETAVIFETLEPSIEERAAISIAEQASTIPQLQKKERQRLTEEFEMLSVDADELLRRSREIGFVDSEPDGDERLLFNGNLFRRDNIIKSKRVLDSLTDSERSRINEVSHLLDKFGCVDRDKVRELLTDSLFEKLLAASFYDVNIVSNNLGEHAFVTAPSAFHKFVDPMVDDAFDLAKSLVAAITYGISKSSSGRGRITMPSILLDKLVRGQEIGPATAIGEDYRVLELKRVIQLRNAGKDMYFMRLLKIDIGQIAQQVITQGGSTDSVLSALPSAAMTGYVGPEETRANFRKNQNPPSRKHTSDILQTLREQGKSW